MPRPFFSVLHERLDQDRDVRLEDLLAAAGQQTYGLLILLLALPSLVPGVNVGAAPVGGAVVTAIGVQLARGVPHPWLPRGMRRMALHKGRIKSGLARLEAFLDRFASRSAKQQPLNQVWVGGLVAWTGLLLALPVPMPFGNVMPAALLCLLGAAILEQRPAWAWPAAFGTLGVTVYFGLSFNLVVKGVSALFR